jgi:hypothetical protein
MNRTNWEHVIYAMLMQIIVGVPTGNWWAGVTLAVGFFTGREHAQREYHLGNPSKLPPWAAFDIWRWKLDAQLDLICPVVAVLLMAVFMQWWSI